MLEAEWATRQDIGYDAPINFEEQLITICGLVLEAKGLAKKKKLLGMSRSCESCVTLDRRLIDQHLTILCVSFQTCPSSHTDPCSPFLSPYLPTAAQVDHERAAR